MKKVIHILSCGLGGHFDVVKNIIEGDEEKKMKPVLFFYGVVPLVDFFKIFCEENNIEYYYFFKDAKFDFNNQHKIWKTYKKVKPDAVFFHVLHCLPFFYLFNFFKRKNFIAIEHQAIKLKTKIDNALSFIAVNLANKIVVINNSFYKYYHKKYKLFLNQKKLSLIYNGVKVNDSNFYLNNPKNKVYNFGMFCRINALKDLETLIDATFILKNRKVENIKLHIAGEGNLLPVLKQKVEENKLQHVVKFYGLITKKEIYSLLKTFDFYIQATLGETISISILDAGSFGIPVIASNVKDLNKIFTEEEILFYELKNPEDLAIKIETFINNNNLKIAYSKKLYKFVQKKANRINMAKKYFELID